MSHYPRCANTFINFCLANKKYLETYIKLGSPRPFDVSLRDGLQSLTNYEQKLFTTKKKIDIYKTIVNYHNPKNIEIGSFVSKSLFPIFNDTPQLLSYAENNKHNKLDLNHYTLVPNEEKIIEAINIDAENFSFISSTSNSFQLKNTKMTLNENYEQLKNMMYIAKNDYSKLYNIKIYISCINECPIEGKIANDKVIEQINKIFDLGPNKICLSDTCGTLDPDDYIDLLEKLRIRNIHNNKFNDSLYSLHLHVKPGMKKKVEEIIHISLSYGITDFDVSALNSGGCSVTMDKNMLLPNLSYDLYYESLCNYLIMYSD